MTYETIAIGAALALLVLAIFYMRDRARQAREELWRTEQTAKLLGEHLGKCECGACNPEPKK